MSLTAFLSFCSPGTFSRSFKRAERCSNSDFHLPRYSVSFSFDPILMYKSFSYRRNPITLARARDAFSDIFASLLMIFSVVLETAAIPQYPIMPTINNSNKTMPNPTPSRVATFMLFKFILISPLRISNYLSQSILTILIEVYESFQVFLCLCS